MLDLRKAFDLVDHSILVEKLRHYGIRGTPLKLIHSFLSDRFQYVCIDGQKSDFRESKIGVPQGSILSPLLFLLFINDFINCSSILNFNLFVDDTSLYLRKNSLSDLFDTLNHELVKIAAWITSNKLSLNVDKTVYLLFSGRRKIDFCPPVNLFGKQIERVFQTKFLGVVIDDKISWKPHVQSLCKKMSRMIGILHKLGDFLTLPAKKTIYYSLIYPHLQYAIIFWNGVCRVDFDKLFRLQKAIVRKISGASKFAHTSPIFSELSIVKLAGINRLEMCKFIHHDIRFSNKFNFMSRNMIHNYETRFSTYLDLPNFRSKKSQNSVFYLGLKYYNDLPSNIKCLDDINSFKLKLKYIVLSDQ